MGIKDWPAAERPREKLTARGPVALSDAELLAIFIGSGRAGVDAVTLARRLLKKFSGLRAVLRAGRVELLGVAGIGAAKYAMLQAAAELGRRMLRERMFRDGPLSSPQQASQYLTAALRDRDREVFVAIFLNTRHFVIDCEELFQGTIDAASVHPREVARRALAHNAAAVIVAHNHPSGVAETSGADQALTRRLKEALALVDVRLLDHLIIGDGEPVALSERGML